MKLNVIQALLEDQQNNIWINTIGGISRYHKITGKFFRYFYKSTTAKKVTENEYKLSINADGEVFCYAANGVLSKYDFKTDKFIVKPVVSGGSKNTFKVTAANVDEINEKLKTLVQIEDFILQPFIKEIEENGELSFLFFNGKFSHALLKKAAKGDFRVQATFGGTVHPQQPSDELVAAAQKYIDQFAKECLYARVDGAMVNNEFMLMELELIEPFLFLDTNEKALENYYQALKEWV